MWWVFLFEGKVIADGADVVGRLECTLSSSACLSGWWCIHHGREWFATKETTWRVIAHGFGNVLIHDKLRRVVARWFTSCNGRNGHERNGLSEVESQVNFN